MHMSPKKPQAARCRQASVTVETGLLAFRGLGLGSWGLGFQGCNAQVLFEKGGRVYHQDELSQQRGKK